MRTAEQILALYEERRRLQMPLQSVRAEIRDIYDGRTQITLPDLPDDQASSVPNLLGQGIDQMAARVASVIPQVTFSPDTPGVRAAERRADTARRVIQGWWENDTLPLKMKRRARHLIGYGASPVKMRWNPRLHRPTWTLRDTLETYPNPDENLDNEQPADVIFAYRRSVGWLRANGYGWALDIVTTRSGRPTNDDLMLLVEYVDPDGCHLVLTGQSNNNEQGNQWLAGYSFGTSGKASTTLEFYETYGVMTASVPSRITLSRPGGQFDTMVGMYHTQAKMMALEVLAVEKGIFPDTYLIGRPNETPRFMDGPHDGRSGKVNVVQGGDVKVMNEQPGYMTPQIIDRLERGQRVTAGMPQEFGGESGSNIRTGRRGDAVMSAAIDFPLAEAQEVFAKALQDENRAAIALAKRYDGSATRTIYVGTGNTTRAVTYKADDVFTHDEHVVLYPVTGTDMNSLLISLGQRVGMGTMSKETAAELDPFISSPEVEHDRIIAEGLEQALVSGIQQQAASGQLPPLVVGQIMELVRNDKMELPQAMVKVVEDAQRKAQEQAAQQQQMAGPPAPDAMAQAGPAAAQALTGSPIPGQSPGQADLAGLLSTLRKPTMTIHPMRGAATGAM
jgi:hypothetical protein